MDFPESHCGNSNAKPGRHRIGDSWSAFSQLIRNDFATGRAKVGQTAEGGCCTGDGHRGTAQRFEAATGSTVLIFTVVSMKARAARLRALSLRKTRAKSRRIWASAMVTATSTLACTSSCTLEQAMKHTPTSAATKRLSNSLESSSMAYCGFSLYS